MSQREQAGIWLSDHPQHLRLRSLDSTADRSVSDENVHGNEDQIGLSVLHWRAFLHWQRDETGGSGSYLYRLRLPLDISTRIDLDYRRYLLRNRRRFSTSLERSSPKAMEILEQ